MRRIVRMSLWGRMLCGMVGCGLLMLGAIEPVQAFPADHWALGAGEQLEVLRDFICFNEGRAGERVAYKNVVFFRNVLSAEVVLSGFNMWYTREGHDHEVMQERVDAWVNKIGLCDVDNPTLCDNRYVSLKFMYAMRDENTSDSDDFNQACIGFTVLARTR